MTANAIQLTPYIHFDGDCEEALNSYRQILGGDIVITSRYDNPAMNAPEAYKNKILHASYTFSGNTIMASDTMYNNNLTRSNGDVHLSLDVATEEEGNRIFDALSKDGKVHIPFKKQFWGGFHGNFVDKYGIRWMVNCR